MYWVDNSMLFQMNFNEDDLDDENTILAREGEPCIDTNEFDNLVSVKYCIIKQSKTFVSVQLHVLHIATLFMP